MLARLPIPNEAIVDVAPEIEPTYDGVWFQNGGVVKPYNKADWMENCGYFASGGRNRPESDNT